MRLLLVLIFIVSVLVTGCGETKATTAAVVTKSPSPTIDAKAQEEAKAKAEADAKKKAEEDAKAKAVEDSTKNTVYSGENGILSDEVLIGVGENKDNYDEMFKYITKKNEAALKQMIIEGRVYYAQKGTKITVIDRGIINAKVQVIGTGIRGWVPVEYLAKQ